MILPIQAHLVQNILNRFDLFDQLRASRFVPLPAPKSAASSPVSSVNNSRCYSASSHLLFESFGAFWCCCILGAFVYLASLGVILLSCHGQDSEQDLVEGPHWWIWHPANVQGSRTACFLVSIRFDRCLSALPRLLWRTINGQAWIHRRLPMLYGHSYCRCCL